MFQTLVTQDTIKTYISLQFRMSKHFPNVHFYTFWTGIVSCMPYGF